jgi:phenylalanyl-tRNA synthetase beta chain
MRLLVSWLRDFVDVTASGEEIAERLGLRGFEVAAVEPFDGGDTVIDFEVTANRPDCLSVIGLAREVATVYDLPLIPPSLTAGARRVGLRPLETGHADRLTVRIADEALCPRYAAAVAEVTVGESPAWMAARLRAAGVRPISSIVDVTNYVLVETGHPTHAFDLAKLAGAEIVVRRAMAGESITTLDGVGRTLDSDMLVIADRDRPQAVAGVMGGALAEVSPATTVVAFESALFQPASVRRTSKRLGLKTEASSRFERGADISAPMMALQRISALLEQIGAGRTVGPAVDVYPRRREPARLHLRRARLTALLGAVVPDTDVKRILTRLGLTVADAADGWEVEAPTFRVDLVREVDLIEEVGRHYGFDRLPDSFPAVTVPAAKPDPRIARDQLVRRILTAAGLTEAVTFGFIEAKAAEAFVLAGGHPPIAIANPLSAKFDTMRPSLLPGLIDAVAHNRRHGRDDVGLFEIGTRFSDEGESRAVGVAWTGSADPVHWSGGARRVDFFDAKGIVELVCEALSVTPRFEVAREPFMAPGQTASVVAADGRRLGLFGQVSPVVADSRGLPRQDRVFAVELNLDLVAAVRSETSDAVRPLPRQPFVVRDLSVAVADTLPAEIIRGTIRTAGETTSAPLVGITFFDRFQGKGVPEGSVSLSVRLTFQAPDRTLTDAEVQKSVDTILAALVGQHRAVQR